MKIASFLVASLAIGLLALGSMAMASPMPPDPAPICMPAADEAVMLIHDSAASVPAIADTCSMLISDYQVPAADAGDAVWLMASVPMPMQPLALTLTAIDPARRLIPK